MTRFEESAFHRHGSHIRRIAILDLSGCEPPLARGENPIAVEIARHWAASKSACACRPMSLPKQAACQCCCTATDPQKRGFFSTDWDCRSWSAQAARKAA
jgi:hypothetical protein